MNYFSFNVNYMSREEESGRNEPVLIYVLTGGPAEQVRVGAEDTMWIRSDFEL